MELKQISKWIVISGSIIIWIIKFGIRPFHIHYEPLKFFLGIAPNLFGSFLIPFGGYWFFSGKDFLLARVLRIQSLYQLRSVCLMGLGMLVINEYLQLIPVFGRTFDYYDILFSVAGLSSSYFFFGRLLLRYKILPE